MKTKYRIMQTMEALLKEYNYDQITIAMITEKVPIARQGFYKFYKNKEDLCRKMYLYFTDRAAVMSQSFSLREFIQSDLTEINEHMGFFNKLADQAYDNALFPILHDNIYQIYTKMIQYRTGMQMSEDMAFMLDGYCIGGLHKLIKVLRDETSLDVKHLTDLFIEMIPGPVQEVLLSGKYPAEIIT